VCSKLNKPSTVAEGRSWIPMPRKIFATSACSAILERS
jgi:hypothetical protein